MMRSLLLLGLALLSCRPAQPRKAEPPSANVRARQIWKAHEAAVARAVKGEVRDDEFARACVFFQEVAGIEVHGQGEFIGWMPTKETGGDLERLRTWYQQNADRLRADEKGQVTVTGTPGRRPKQ